MHKTKYVCTCGYTVDSGYTTLGPYQPPVYIIVIVKPEYFKHYIKWSDQVTKIEF